MLFTDVLYICSLSALPKQIIHKLYVSPLATQVEKNFQITWSMLSNFVSLFKQFFLRGESNKLKRKKLEML